MRAPGHALWGTSLRCGPFIGERYQGSLRWLHSGAYECVRMIGLVVRDRAWRTLAPAALREHARNGEWTNQGRTPVERSALVWTLAFTALPKAMEVRATITTEGHALTNRTGLVVLLPAATFAGASFVVRHSDGSPTRGRLPREIAPYQPMSDVTAARLTASKGPVLALRFEGDVFEMEDQRNWLDPSFKIYNRPLSRPYPYRIRDGERVEQRIVIEVARSPLLPGPRRTRTVVRRGSLPALGIASAPGRVPSRSAAMATLAETQPGFILHRTDTRARGLKKASRLAQLLQAQLRTETFGDSSALARAIALARPQAVAPYFSSTEVQSTLARYQPQIVGGTFADFVMLNRHGADVSADRVTFSLCPTVHGRDDRSIIETLESLPQVFSQGRKLAGTRPLDIGPCALRRRLLPLTGKPAVQGPSGEGGDYDVDPRQHTNIAAAWLACTVAIAAAAGVSTVCTFEGEGDRGLVYQDPCGDRAHAAAVLRSPAHAVLQAFAGGHTSTVTVYAVNARCGAMFTVEASILELWLVDLSGRARVLPHAAKLDAGVRLICGTRGARWAGLAGAAGIGAYGIFRVPLASVPRSRVAAVAQRWCFQRRP